MTHRRPKDKNASIEWARDVMSRLGGCVFWDTETTGLGRTAEIIQIGVLASDGSVLLDSFVRPLSRKTIPREAVAIHGITMKMLAGAPSYPELVPTLIKTLEGKWVIAYNADFEERLLRQTAQRNGGPILSLPWSCAMLHYSRFVGEWMEYKREYKWQRLPGAGHNAVADCRATLELVQRMANTPLLVVPRRWWQFWL
jgi:DNA polymerase-3 subunit epsilon